MKTFKQRVQHRGLWFIQTNQKRTLLCEHTVGFHTAKVTHFRCLFLYPRIFLTKRTVVFPLVRAMAGLTVVSVFITRLSLPLKSKPHSGLYCSFQCTARRKVFKFKCRWNHLISVEYSEHAFCTKRCNRSELELI